MSQTPPSLRFATARIIAAVQARLPSRTLPLLVAIDGGSGAGKSTLASLLAAELGAALIPSDDFFAAGITDSGWNARTAPQRAADAIDWHRLRAQALEPLLGGRPACWHPFDFARQRPDGTYPLHPTPVVCEPAPIIILDGAYSARPELADLVDLAVLVDVPAAVRHARLAAREDPQFLAAWHARWDGAEEYYFTHVRPPTSFDIIVTLQQLY